MRNISVLDCTLRDGGYINNWMFGEQAINGMLGRLCDTNVDFLEIGFLRDEPYTPDRVVFRSMQQAQGLIDLLDRKNRKMKFAVMAEIAHPIPLDLIEPAEKNDIDVIRVIVWKSKQVNGRAVDMLQEGYEYCRGIVEKGYQLCVQPNRTDQYSDAEFRNMIGMFRELSPMAIYVVDSWGTMYSDQVIHYMDMADRLLPDHISVGFHGHNNLMQAFSTAEKITEQKYDRNIMLDASVYGIGRGAGNLNLELIAGYLNHMYGCHYNTVPMLEIYDRFLKDMRKQNVWGSDIPFMVSAMFGANPNYATDFREKLSAIQMQEVFCNMDVQDRILYTKESAERYRSRIE